MKKTIYLLLLSFLAVSCYEEVILPVGGDEPRAVMNAQLNTKSTFHTVYMSVAQKSHVRALSGADVRVFVNGTLAATAEEMPPGMRASMRPNMPSMRLSDRATKSGSKRRKMLFPWRRR